MMKYREMNRSGQIRFINLYNHLNLGDRNLDIYTSMFSFTLNRWRIGTWNEFSHLSDKDVHTNCFK